MYCPRLNHFIRLNADGSIGKCGHMNSTMGFETVEQLENSTWLKDIKQKMQQDIWPEECLRCQQTEEIEGDSVRLKSIKRHKALYPLRNDYLVVGGTLDNTCNSACQTCNAELSTKIGSLESKDYLRVDNYVRFWEIPQDRILEVDVNGGEPTASKNYKKILSHLPPNTRIVRMNTNASRMIPELEDILRKRILTIVTLSFDGTGDTHDYVRWPIKWKNYVKTVESYKNLQKQWPNLKINSWTTLCCLNDANLPSILDFTVEHDIEHAWAFLNKPQVLDPRFKNYLTVNAREKLKNSSYPTCRNIAEKLATKKDNTEQLNSFIKRQDYIRKIDIKDYLSFDENLSKNN